MTIPAPRASAAADVHIAATEARAYMTSRGRNASGPGSPVTGSEVSRTPADPGGTAGQPAPRVVPLSQPPSAARLCPVTTYPTLDNWSPRLYSKHRCGAPVVAGGLCAKHLADRDRLAAHP